MVRFDIECDSNEVRTIKQFHCSMANGASDEDIEYCYFAGCIRISIQ